MSDVAQDLCAVGRFLASYRGAAEQAAFDQAAARQVKPLLDKIRQGCWNPDVAVQALTAIREAPWPPSEAAALTEAIEAAVAASPAETPNKVANRTQTCRHVDQFLTIGLVKVLQGRPHGVTRIKLATYTEYLVRLGLRWPSERTSQLAAGVLIAVAGDQDMTDQALEPDRTQTSPTFLCPPPFAHLCTQLLVALHLQM